MIGGNIYNDIYPKFALNESCNLYEKKQGKQIIYKRNNVLYCRNKPNTRFSNTEQNLLEIFNVNNISSLNSMITGWKLQIYPSFKQVKLVASVLDINYESIKFNSFKEKIKKQKILKESLIKSIGNILINDLIIIDDSNKNKLSPLQLIVNDEDITNLNDKINWSILLLSKIIKPDNFNILENIKISDILYNHYLSLYSQEDKFVRDNIFSDNELLFSKLDSLSAFQLKETLSIKYSYSYLNATFKNNVYKNLKKSYKLLDPYKVAKDEVLKFHINLNNKKELIELPFHKSILILN